MYEPEDIEEAIDSIPINNLGDSGLKVFTYDKWEKGDPTKPNNVLIAGLDSFDRVSVVGRDKETGDLYYASSEDDIDTVVEDLSRFIYMLKQGQFEE